MKITVNPFVQFHEGYLHEISEMEYLEILHAFITGKPSSLIEKFNGVGVVSIGGFYYIVGDDPTKIAERLLTNKEKVIE